MVIRRTQKAMLLLMILALAAPGCGGRKKSSDEDKNAQQASSGGAVVQGRVDLLSGFGLEMDRAGLSAKIGKGAMLKLYRFSGQGADLMPLEGFTPKPLAPDGVFTLDSVPAGQVNLVLSVETQQGERALSGLIPFVPSGGVKNLVVSPETNLETEVFKQILLNKSRGGAALAALTHQNLDASLVKRIVTADAVFDPAVQQNPAAAAQALGAAAASALTAYVETLAGPDRPISDPAVQTVTTALRESVSSILMQQEWDFINPPAAPDTGLSPAARMNQAIASASAQTAPRASGLSSAATIALAGDRVLIQTARCLAGNGGACPAPATGSVSFESYARALESQTAHDAAARDAALRLLSPSAAPGSFEISVTSALDVMRKLVALPDAQIALLIALANQSAAALSQPGADMLEARARSLRAYAAIRDYAGIAFLDMDHSTITALAADLERRAASLAREASSPDSPLDTIANRRKEFFEQADKALEPLRTQITSAFSKLPESDQNKLFHSMKSLFLCAGLEGVPAVLFQSADTDGDGVDDDTETTLGTDPAKADSAPADVVAKSPQSLLPDAPADQDQDGIPDIIEIMNGSDPDDAGSKPVMAALAFCSKSADKFPCPGAASASGETQEQLVTISGQIVFSQSPVPGAIAGLYASPVFLDRKPLHTADAPAGASGTFTIKAPAGRYFVAAFIDADGNGAPGQGEAAGFLGAIYPERIVMQKNVVLASSVDMIGMIGGSPCQEGAWISPETGACETRCPAGTSPNALTGECRCESGMFAVTTGKCEQACPGITVPGAGGTRCVCPPHSLLDQVQGACHCAVGMAFDNNAAACVCSEGFFNPRTEACAESCPPGMPADNASKTCACPGGSQFDQSTGSCVCDNGKFLNSLSGTCVQQCPQGTAPDSAGRTCVCPQNQKPGRGGSCECESGFVLDEKTGACTAPSPGTAQRPDTGTTAPDNSKPEKTTKPDDAKKQPTPPSDRAPRERPDRNRDRNAPGVSESAPEPAGTTGEAGHTLTDPGAEPPPGFVPESDTSQDSD